MKKIALSLISSLLLLSCGQETDSSLDNISEELVNGHLKFQYRFDNNDFRSLKTTGGGNFMGMKQPSYKYANFKTMKERDGRPSIEISDHARVLVDAPSRKYKIVKVGNSSIQNNALVIKSAGGRDENGKLLNSNLTVSAQLLDNKQSSDWILGPKQFVVRGFFKVAVNPDSRFYLHNMSMQPFASVEFFNSRIVEAAGKVMVQPVVLPYTPPIRGNPVPLQKDGRLKDVTLSVIVDDFDPSESGSPAVTFNVSGSEIHFVGFDWQMM